MCEVGEYSFEMGFFDIVYLARNTAQGLRSQGDGRGPRRGFLGK